MTRDPESIAAQLLSARQTGVPMSRAVFPDSFDADEGRGVQSALEGMALRAGRAKAGRKIGLTSPAAMALFKAEEPMIGTIFGDTIAADGGVVDYAGLIAPRIEGEFLIEIGHVPPPGADDKVLLAAIANVRAAFEIADSRIEGWPADVAQATADNACCGLVVPGSVRAEPASVDFTGAASIMYEDGEIISQGSAADCMGSVLQTWRWLLQRADVLGLPLEPGDIVLCGAMGKAVPMKPGRRYDLTVAGLGSVGIVTSGEKA